MLKTRITDLFGIEYPIVQGGMRHVARAELAAAVSEGGGLGFVSAHTQPDAAALAREIERARALTRRPVGVNLTILPHLKGARPEDYLAAILDMGVPVVETAGANPAPYIARLKAAGIKVLHKCTELRFALKAEAMGADAVSLTSLEAGGHTGNDPVPALVLVPLVAARLRIPFIASGGCATGAQLAAALALGADGVNMGSRFALTRESPLHPNVKALFLAAGERDTRVILRSLGDPIRVVDNAQVARVLELEREGAPPELLHDEGGALRWIAASERGDAQGGAFAAGISIALIPPMATDALPSAADVVRTVAAEAREVVAGRMTGMLA